jgi:phospholipase D1/2
MLTTSLFDRTVMHFQYVSISRGGNSILEKLKEAGIDASQYIGWYCLRNWAKNKPSDTDNTDSTAHSNGNNNGKKKKDRRTDSGTALSQQHQEGSTLTLDESTQPSPQQSSSSINASSRSSSYSSTPPTSSSSKQAPPATAFGTIVDNPLQNKAYLNAAADESEDDRKYYVSELIYIHDKLLIVDDRIVLVGSGMFERIAIKIWDS